MCKRRVNLKKTCQWIIVCVLCGYGKRRWKWYLKDWCLGNIMTAGVKKRVFPTMGKAVKAEGSQRAGRDLDRSGEAREGLEALRRLKCGGLSYQANTCLSTCLSAISDPCPSPLCLHQDVPLRTGLCMAAGGGGEVETETKKKPNWRKEGEPVTHTRDQHLSILETRTRAATANQSGNPVTSIVSQQVMKGYVIGEHGTVLPWPDAYTRPSLEDPVALVHTFSLRDVVLHTYPLVLVLSSAL